MDLPYREEKTIPKLKIKYRPTATTNEDQTLQKLSGDWSTSGKRHDCFSMVVIIITIIINIIIIVIVIIIIIIIITADY